MLGVIFVSANVADILLINFLYHHIAKCKVEKMIQVKLIILCVFLMTTLNFFGIGKLQFIISSVMCFLLIYYTYEYEHLVLSYCCYIILVLLSKIISLILGNMLLQVSLYEVLSNSEALILLTIIGKVIKFGLLSILISLTNLRVKDRIEYTAILGLLILPSSTLGLLLSSTNFLTKAYRFSIVFILSAIGLLFANYILITFIDRIIKANNDLRNLEIAEKQREFDQTYLSLLESKQESMRIYNHDFKRHIHYLLELSKDGNITEVRDYLEKLQENTQKVLMEVNTGLKLVDFILYGLQEQIVRYAIHYNVLIDDNLDVSWINQDDLNVLLSNILENVIENSILTAEPYFKLEMYMRGTFLIIKIINSCTAAIKMDNKFVTRKKDKEGHGLGLTSIKNIASKYNGNVDFHYDDEQNMFHTKVILHYIR